MKKIYSLIAAVAVVLSANAQDRAVPNSTNNSHKSSSTLKVKPMATDRAVGDTIMYFPGQEIYLTNSADQASFNVVTEDIDQLPTNNAGQEMAFGLYYSINADTTAIGAPTNDNMYHPWEDPLVDSSFFYLATSWFNPAGTANNWLIFGPITVGAAANLNWYDRTNPAYRDGYKVYIANTVSSPYTFADFTDAAIYTKTDAYPSPTYTTDTTWVMRTTSIPAQYCNAQIYVAFNHTANDMDVLYLDEFNITEASLGIEEFENGAKLFQNMPNPFNNQSTISYELNKSAKVALNVYDVTGKKVIEQIEGNQSVGKHNVVLNASNLSAGIYYYSLSVDNNKTSTKKMVIVK